MTQENLIKILQTIPVEFHSSRDPLLNCIDISIRLTLKDLFDYGMEVTKK